MDRQESVPNSEFLIRYNRNKSAVSKLCPIGRELLLTDSKTDSKIDTMAYIIHCPKHDSVAVYEDPNSNIRWLPFTPNCPDKYVMIIMLNVMLNTCFI